MILQEQQNVVTTLLEHECIDYQCPGNCPLCPFSHECVDYQCPGNCTLCPFSSYEYPSTYGKNFRPFDVEW